MSLFKNYRVVTFQGVFIPQVRLGIFEWAGIEKIPNVSFVAFNLWHEKDMLLKYCNNKSVDGALLVIELYKSSKDIRKMKVIKYVK